MSHADALDIADIAIRDGLYHTSGSQIDGSGIEGTNEKGKLIRCDRARTPGAAVRADTGKAQHHQQSHVFVIK